MNDIELISKSIVYRFCGTILTAAIVYILTGNIVISWSAGILEFLTKIIFYWLYDKTWIYFHNQIVKRKKKRINDTNLYHKLSYRLNRSEGTKCYWFTGLQCSGKTTLAKKFCDVIPNSILLDGDAIRQSINYDIGFTKDDVRTNIVKIANLCKLLMDQGYNVIVSCVSKNKNDRAEARSIIGENQYTEIYCTCDNKELLRRRDSLHKDTKILFNTYEFSDYTFFVINTSSFDVNDCLRKLKNEFGYSWSKK